MGHFKFQWNQKGVKVDFDGNVLEFASNLSSYLISAKMSGIKEDMDEANNILLALTTAVSACKSVK